VGNPAKTEPNKRRNTMQDVELKTEALRMATLIMTQSATAAKGDKVPSPDDVLKEAETIYIWLKK